MEIRVRYAPSPTGYLHIGGARTAIFNYLFAKNKQGKFIVRIEDTDVERNIEDGITSQVDNLRWIGLEIDETVDHEGAYGPYQQTKRLAIYQEYAKKLVNKQQAYYCFCSEAVIAAMRQQQKNLPSFKYDQRCLQLSNNEITNNLKIKKPHVIRIKIPANRYYFFDDIVRGKISFHTRDLGDFVIIKSNGIATYNFAVVIDDYLMKISHVLRGEEHLSNTPRQLVVYDHFGWKPPRFGHLTLIVNDQGKKLSKRDGQVMQFIHQYRKQGFLPAALFNFITLLGWNSHEEREIYSRDELIKIFKTEYLSKAPSMFDIQKLLWMNNFYIKKLSEEQYLNLVIPFVKVSYQWDEHTEEWWREVLLIYQRQLMYGAEIVTLIALFLQKIITFSDEAKMIITSKTSKIIIKALVENLQLCQNWDITAIKEAIAAVKNKTNYCGKELLMPIRIACTGQTKGPELPQTLKLLGKKIVLARLAAWQ